jgi:hypothetical protein
MGVSKKRRPPVLFNPALLSSTDLASAFVVRQNNLVDLLDQIRSADEGTLPAHQLVYGERGMGKTMLLHRLAAEVASSPQLANTWLPVLFDEEQYNVGSLADFWWNCLEMILDYEPPLKVEYGTDEEAFEETTRRFLAAEAEKCGRRLLLLVDNMDLVIERIQSASMVSAHRLRQVLQTETWLMLVGCSATTIKATFDYDSPFYEMFRVSRLLPLGEDETRKLLVHLGMAPARSSGEGRDLVGALIPLMGGNPRTITMMADMFAETELIERFLRMLDRSTPFFKERLEVLSPQSQRIFESLAAHWHPATAGQIARAVRLKPGPVSAQLHRLVERNLVEKVDPIKRQLRYQLRERLFNLWYLMRASRRTRERLRGFLQFLAVFYGPTPQSRMTSARPTGLKKLRLALAKAKPEARPDMLGQMFALACDGQAVELLHLLEESDIHKRWTALTHALAIHTGEHDRLEQLCPEMKRVVADIVTALESPRSAPANPY